MAPGDALVVQRNGAGRVAADLERRLERQPHPGDLDLPPISPGRLWSGHARMVARTDVG
jgi:hypothetical protein